MQPSKPYKIITTKSIFIITLLVIVLTIFVVGHYFEVGQHKTLFQISIVSISILSITLFFFLTIGLYIGIKLKDNVGNITTQRSKTTHPITSFIDGIYSGYPIPPLEEGEIIGIGAWIGMAIAVVFFTWFFIWFFAAIVWPLIIMFVAILYWIFFRAVRIVFKKSGICKGNLIKSSVYGLTYTILYSIWIYGIILCTHYFIKFHNAV